MSWFFVGGVAAAFALLAGRGAFRRRAHEEAASASGLEPAASLAHMPEELQRTALWSLADGGFERRVVHGVVPRGEDVDVTAFDLETLRDRRGEWAWLPVAPPFRIGGVVSVVVCRIDRAIPHCLFKREGGGDALADDSRIERATHIAKLARDRLGMKRSYAAELPAALPAAPLALETLPVGWRAYGAHDRAVAELLNAGFGKTLAHAGRRDLVVEILGELVVIYPAARDVVGADAFADLTETALAIVDGVLACTPRMSPRGVEALK